MNAACLKVRGHLWLYKVLRKFSESKNKKKYYEIVRPFDKLDLI